ncbi:glycosyltransferase family 9 protein [Streptomyces canus]|uniref:glycosyltransferase family 9 protein n=1 Tax=Streptomyces canus TaxID=58343 RepID=UPI0030DE2C18
MPEMLPPPVFGAPEHTMETFEVRPDCRYYDGGLPCRFRRPCHGCDRYDPVGSRILIVLLEALGDILITSPLPGRLKREHPGAHITWLVYEHCAPLVRLNPHVDRVLVYGWETMEQLGSETYDLVLGLERVRAAAALVDRIQARKKVGIAHRGRHNALEALDDRSREILMLDTWNDYRTKFNTKSWTELYFQVANLEYENEPYVAEPRPDARARVASYYGRRDDRTTICLNVGGSFPQKVWPDRHWLSLALSLINSGKRMIFMGGPAEGARCKALVDGLRQAGAGPEDAWYEPLTLEETCAVPEHCDAMVTNDSFGYHVGLLGGLPCVVLFGPSTPAEVLLPHVDNVNVLRSGYACSPCAHQMLCEGAGGCMDVIEPKAVEHSLTDLLRRTRGES